jgi:glycosyltransferase involved in cell wall biosynthesis
MAHRKVSILMASFNYAQYIGQAIDSVLQQTFGDWELIIVDDGSTDQSLKIINKYVLRDGDRIQCYVHPGHENRNLKETIHLALSKAQGQTIAFLEADDSWHRCNLERKLDILERYPDVSVVYSAVSAFGTGSAFQNKQGYAEMCSAIARNYKQPFVPLAEMTLMNIIPTFSTAITRKKLLERVHLTTEHQAWLDWWIWRQLATQGMFYCLPDELVHWRIHDSSYNYRFTQALDVKGNIDNFNRDIERIMSASSNGKLQLSVHRNSRMKVLFLTAKAALRKLFEKYR